MPISTGVDVFKAVKASCCRNFEVIHLTYLDTESQSERKPLMFHASIYEVVSHPLALFVFSPVKTEAHYQLG